MDDFVGTLIGFVFLWGLPLFAITGILSFYADRRISRGHARGWPPTWPARVAKILLSIVTIASIFGLVTVLGPGRGLAEGARRFHRTLGEVGSEVSFRRVEDDVELGLGQFEGSVVLLNLWATNCPPCLRELPELDRLLESYGEQGLVVITLSQEPREDLLAFAAKRPFKTINVYAAEIDWLEVGDARPVSLVFDRQGALRDFTLAARSFQGFERMIRPYL